MVAIASGRDKNRMNECGQFTMFRKNIRPSTWDFPFETGVLRFRAGDPIGSYTPNFSNIVFGTLERLLRLWIDVIYVRIWTHVLPDS